MLPIKDDTVFSLYCVFGWTGTNDSKTQPDYFENGEKKSPFLNKNGYVWTRLELFFAWILL